MKNSELDQIILDALKTDRKLIVPERFTETTMKRIGKRVILRESLIELCMKGGLILGSLVVLTFIIAWFKGYGFLLWIYGYLTQYWQVSASIAILVFFTVFIDQVLLKTFLSSGDRPFAERFS